ncbi:MAG: beta-ketoacyl-ACP synthase FabY [Candidatus Pelagadaptatus aseana]|uniref:beta-ketoacyl synthase n=1 Tax=Candidatus Pelagadaptatus aseana TaxID=3120508 RepID=UPI0039B350D7
MARLPVIVGFGGYNAAGRTSFHHGFRRMVIESIDRQSRLDTLAGLAVMTKQVAVSDDGDFISREGEVLSLEEIETRLGNTILNSTLVRRIEKSFFDVDHAKWQQSMTLDADAGQSTSFILSKSQLPKPVPATWQLEDAEDGKLKVTLDAAAVIKVDSEREFPVKAAGQLPSGFDPGELYNSRFHPRGLQMTVVAASDALHSVGIEWDVIKNAVQPDEIAVYASSGMGQLDDNGFGGMIKSRSEGNRVSAKQLALGLNTMPADFVNAYVLGNVGTTSASTGACASFLYNLKNGIEAIQQNKARVVMVGCSEAPVVPEIIDGYATMGALGTDENLKKIEAKTDDEPDHRRASRPFGDNCGFTIAESAQFFVLMDDELALELGAQIHGAVPEVFINADGFKKSIPAPGPGNFITLAKAVAAAKDLVGIEAVQHHSVMYSHGSSTPQNRVTESELFDRVAEAFDINEWPVAAVKAYVGHPLAPASGDQLAVALGSFHYNLLPGIKTIDKVADDVVADRLLLPLEDLDLSDRPTKVAFLNSKGFGGNNATAVVLSPGTVASMMAKRHGDAAMAAWSDKVENTHQAASNYDQAATRGDYQIVYRFGEGMIDENALEITQNGISVPGFAKALCYGTNDRYADMI